MTSLEKLARALAALVGTTFLDAVGYVLLAGGVWLFFYVVFQQALRHRRVGRSGPADGQAWREFRHSLRSIAIFGIVTGAVVYAGYSGWTRLYLHISDYGWSWFLLSIGVMIVVHDAYFYWTHRLMHHRRLYRLLRHDTHHRSSHPTPWAAYAFSPAEAFIQAGIGPLIVFVVPVHPVAFGLFMTWQLAFNVFGHCGYEIFPAWFLRSRAGWLLNSVTHHALHHEAFRMNYGLYFAVWDRLLRTTHPDYEQRFERAAAGPQVMAAAAGRRSTR